MFKLFVASANVDSGTISVSWCVSEATLKKLARLCIREPQVVLCVSPKPDGRFHYTSREYRKVVPLRDLMTYVEFKYPGENRIHGFISLGSERSARNNYLSRYRLDYHSDILNNYGDDWTDGVDWRGISWIDEDARDVISVDVPVDCFAPEPYAWEQAWVNHHFAYKCIDQCEYRRRRIFAYTLQPILMAFNLLLRMLILIGGVLVGTRGAIRNWTQVFKPLTYNAKELFFSIFSGGTVFVKTPKTDEPKSFWPFVWWGLSHLKLIPFMPLVLIPLLIVLGVVGVTPTVCFIALIGGTILGLAVIVMMIIMIIAKLSTFSKSKKFWYTEDDEMLNLICDIADKPTKVSQLPRKHRTIKLRLSEFKSKVCRPFSG